MNSNYTDDPYVSLRLIASYATLTVLLIWAFFLHEDKMFTLWLTIRKYDLAAWHLTAGKLLGTNFFLEGVKTLHYTNVEDVTWSYVGEFESHYNRYLRFFYALFFFVVGGKIIYNYNYVTRRLDVQSMIELWRHESEAIDTLVEDNPLKHHLRYDFSNRCDYHNRHAQALSPEQYITACPPPNATSVEMENYELACEEGDASAFRPIAVIDREKSTMDFNHTLARRSLERQLTNPPVEAPYYNDKSNVPRLFDAQGELVPLEYDDQGRIVGGFAKEKLLNGGRDYHGTPEDVALLFDGVEREVFYTLCERYNNPLIALEDVVLELTKLHAYSRTFLVAFLNIVRENAVVASTEFYLICRRDRALYFSLYSATEEKPFYEALAVMAHYEHEVLVDKKVPFPVVTSAVESLHKDAKRIGKWKPVDTDLLTRLAHSIRDEPDLNPVFSPDDSLEGSYAGLDGADAVMGADAGVSEQQEVHHEQ